MSTPESPASRNPNDAANRRPDDDAQGARGDEAFLGLPAGLDDEEEGQTPREEPAPADDVDLGLDDALPEPDRGPEHAVVSDIAAWPEVAQLLAELDANTPADGEELDGLDDPTLLSDSSLGCGNDDEADSTLDVLGDLDLAEEPAQTAADNERDVGPLEPENFPELGDTGVPSGRPWRSVDGRGPSEPIYAVAVAESQLFAAGNSVWHRDAEGLWCEHPRSDWGLVTSLLGVATGTALAATQAGHVLRIERCKGRLEVTTTARFPLPERGEVPAVLSLGSNRVLFTGRSLLALDAEGRIEESLSPACAPLCVASAGAALYAVGTEQHTVRLFRRTALDGWRERELGGLPKEAVNRGATLLCAANDTAAIADFHAGVAVSTNGGVTFTRVVGSATCTALAAGRYGSKTSVWAALFSELDARAALILIDPATGEAETIAEIEARPGRDDEGPRVHALAYDVAAETLYAATEHGLFTFRAPPAERE